MAAQIFPDQQHSATVCSCS